MVTVADVEHALAERVARDDLQLPVLPEAAASAMTMVQRPNCDVAALAAVIRRDPSLSASLVKLASSPAYGGAVKLTSVAQAISRLGFSTIVQLTLAVASRATVFDVPGYGTELRAAFRHALVTALFAQEIARFRRAPVDAAFTAGLLHDFGKPLLLGAGAPLGAHRQVLLSAIDASHATVGGTLAARWGFSDAIANAITTHHAPASELAHVVALADGFAHGGPPPATSAQALNMYTEDLGVIVKKAADIMASVDAIA